MDRLTMPYKIEKTIDTYEGEWTAEQIDAGLAGTPRKETQAAWYENTPEGPQQITDVARIRELEGKIKGD